MDELASLILRPRIEEAIKKSAFETFADVCRYPPSDLSNILKLSENDTQELLKSVSEEVYKTRLRPTTALQLLEANKHILLTTGDSVLDDILGGGILCQGITEIVGESSAGKTQLCLQLCMTVQLPPEYGGLNGGAVYLAADNPFPITRFYQLLSSFHHTHPFLSDLDLGSNVHVARILDLSSQYHIIHYQLPVLLSRFNIRLVVIDSIAANFRSDESLMGISWQERARNICELGAKLKELSDRFRVAVVCVNQVSDSIKDEDDWKDENPREGIDVDIQNENDDEREDAYGDGEERQKVGGQYVGTCDYDYRRYQRVTGKIPALGLVWKSSVNMRILLARIGCGRNRKRTVSVQLAPHVPMSYGEFYVDATGIHGIRHKHCNSNSEFNEFSVCV